MSSYIPPDEDLDKAMRDYEKWKQFYVDFGAKDTKKKVTSGAPKRDEPFQYHDVGYIVRDANISNYELSMMIPKKCEINSVNISNSGIKFLVEKALAEDKRIKKLLIRNKVVPEFNVHDICECFYVEHEYITYQQPQKTHTMEVTVDDSGVIAKVSVCGNTVRISTYKKKAVGDYKDMVRELTSGICGLDADDGTDEEVEDEVVEKKEVPIEVKEKPVEKFDEESMNLEHLFIVFTETTIKIRFENKATVMLYREVGDDHVYYEYCEPDSTETTCFKIPGSSLVEKAVILLTEKFQHHFYNGRFHFHRLIIHKCSFAGSLFEKIPVSARNLEISDDHHRKKPDEKVVMKVLSQINTNEKFDTLSIHSEMSWEVIALRAKDVQNDYAFVVDEFDSRFTKLGIAKSLVTINSFKPEDVNVFLKRIVSGEQKMSYFEFNCNPSLNYADDKRQFKIRKINDFEDHSDVIFDGLCLKRSQYTLMTTHSSSVQSFSVGFVDFDLTIQGSLRRPRFDEDHDNFVQLRLGFCENMLCGEVIKKGDEFYEDI